MARKIITCPIASPCYLGVDGLEARDGYYTLKNGYVTREGGVRKRPGFCRNDFGETADGVACSLLNVWDKANGAANHLVAAVGSKIFVQNEFNSSVTTLTSSYGSLQTRNQCVRAPTASHPDSPYLFVTTDVGRPNYEVPGFSSWNTISDTDCPTGAASPNNIASSIGFLNNHLLACYHGNATRRKFYWSDVNDALAWTGMSLENVQSNPDGIFHMRVIDGQIWFFGERSIEVWENDGVSPFIRINGGIIERGISGLHAVTVIGSTIWMVDDKLNFGFIEGNKFEYVPVPEQYNAYWYSTSERLLSNIRLSQKDIVIVQIGDDVTLLYDPELKTWAEWNMAHPAGGNAISPYVIDTAFWSAGPVLGLGNSWGGAQALRSDYWQDQPSYDPATWKNIPFSLKTGHIDYGTLARKRSVEFRMRLLRGQSSTATSAYISFLDDGVNSWGPFEIPLGTSTASDTNHVVTLPATGTYQTRQYTITHEGNAPFAIAHAEEEVEV